jgi:hypothetical protein
MSVFIQIVDGVAVSAFPGPQDPKVWPNVVEVEDDDPRHLEFIKPSAFEPITDPVEKLRAFLASNPDVAEILK